jgi:hypothetical protein
MQGPLAYGLQEKLIPNLIGQNLGTEIKKCRVKVYFGGFLVRTSVFFEYYR